MTKNSGLIFMTNSWDERSNAIEDLYFKKQNEAALERLKEKQKDPAHPSPIDGKAMVKEILAGVVVDRCTTSGGIWLDKGELEQIINNLKAEETNASWIEKFFDSITK